jgi:peptidoglycan hydrolase-like protein with peptidoglycan-binding domain
MDSQRPHPVHRRGDTGPTVAEIRRKLTMLGLLADSPDTLADPEEAVFDDACDRAVRHFQQQRGLNVDGIVGASTYDALEEARWRLGDRVLSHQVSRLQRGDDVAALQRRLLDLGFDCGRVDGIFGPDTARALRELQRSLGVSADGTCGPDTFKALDRLTRTVVGGHAQNLREAEALARSGPRLGGKVVVIDPGHGGLDHGNVANGLTESGIVEDLAARVEGRLTARTRTPTGSRPTTSAPTGSGSPARSASGSPAWSSARSWRGRTCSTAAYTPRPGTFCAAPGCPPSASTSATSRTPATRPGWPTRRSAMSSRRRSSSPSSGSTCRRTTTRPPACCVSAS